MGGMSAAAVMFDNLVDGYVVDSAVLPARES
jgi:hypothetical protein